MVMLSVDQARSEEWIHFLESLDQGFDAVVALQVQVAIQKRVAKLDQSLGSTQISVS